jgi:hypothetical protein
MLEKIVEPRRANMAEKTAGVQTVSDNPDGIPTDLRRKANAKNWPLPIIARALQAGVKEELLHQALDAGMTPLQAREMMAGGQGERPALSMEWSRVKTERGIRARPGSHGLTIDDINIGSYAEVPDLWPDQTMRPRGAEVKPGAVSMGYTIYTKAEVWADNLGSLYEEAIQRRWAPATDIPWNTIAPLPEDKERAIGQLCTDLCEYNYMVILALGKWIREVSYGYHEVKLFLSTVLFDAARHFEAFRKRALANGGGLGVQGVGWKLVPIRDALCYSEMAALVFVVNDSFVQSIYELGAGLAENEAESRLFALAGQDKARHLAYGISHMRYLLEHQPERTEEMRRYLSKGEEYLAKDDVEDAPMRESLAILLGGGLEGIGDGFQKLKDFRRRQVQQYLSRVEAAGLDHRASLWPDLAEYLDPAVTPA